jgi:hypothetical protein
VGSAGSTTRGPPRVLAAWDSASGTGSPGRIRKGAKGVEGTDR